MSELLELLCHGPLDSEPEDSDSDDSEVVLELLELSELWLDTELGLSLDSELELELLELCELTELGEPEDVDEELWLDTELELVLLEELELELLLELDEELYSGIPGSLMTHRPRARLAKSVHPAAFVPKHSSPLTRPPMTIRPTVSLAVAVASRRFTSATRMPRQTSVPSVAVSSYCLYLRVSWTTPMNKPPRSVLVGVFPASTAAESMMMSRMSAICSFRRNFRLE